MRSRSPKAMPGLCQESKKQCVLFSKDRQRDLSKSRRFRKNGSLLQGGILALVLQARPTVQSGVLPGQEVAPMFPIMLVHGKGPVLCRANTPSAAMEKEPASRETAAAASERPF